MARETPKDTEAASGSDKPLPDPSSQRPGTSGTEALLVTNRRQASAKFQAAQKAERTYKAKKRATAARANFGEAKTHFKQAGSHLKKGFSLSFNVVRSAPYFVGEKLDARQEKASESKKLKALEKRKKLEQQLAKENAQRESSETAEPAAADPAAAPAA
ncbi:hypothetical protein GQ53DRAFT_773947 [Thozetella sp. PMI_491]|nr:hypothetical protein GQ53DRAFT_773947 [Thozetella sp. PMI_491]